MSAPKNPKRNHHHVWQAYLKPWTTNGEIWCRSGDQVGLKRIKYVAVDRDFYKLHQLTPEDLAQLKWFISKGSAGSQRTNQQLLDLVMTPYKTVEGIKTLKPATQAILEKYSYEVLEDYHSKIESSFAPALDKARRGDLSFYTDENCVNFIRYVCTQYMRTKGIKERFFMKMAEVGGGDFTRIWSIMIHMFATNIGADLYMKRHARVLQLLENNTQVPFITGDQPVINLKRAGNGTPPEQFAFFYPLSPKLAMHWGEADEPPMKSIIDKHQATELNRKIEDSSYLQVFGHSKESLIL